VPIKELIGCHGGGDDNDGNDDNYDYDDDVPYRSADEVYQLQTAVSDFLIISAHRPTQIAFVEDAGVCSMDHHCLHMHTHTEGMLNFRI